MNSPRFISLIHYGTGLMDAITGCLLIFLPTWTLSLMGVNPRTDEILVSYLGVFVFAVGTSHFFAGSYPTDATSCERWHTIWKISSFVRLCIAFFVLIKIISGQLDAAWISVSATDFVVAIGR